MSKELKSTLTTNSNLLIDQYKTILQAFPHYVYILNKHCELIDCNNNFLSLLAINNIEELQENVYKRLISRVQWSATRVDILKHDDIQALLNEESLQNRIEPPIVDNHEKILYFLSHRIPLKDKQNQVIGLMVVLHDISEQVKMAQRIEAIDLELKNPKNLSPSKEARDLPATCIPYILLIDDNSIAQKAVKAILMQLDCKVETAVDAESMFASFSPGKYDLILMDIGLKDTSGYVMAKQIRQLEQGTAFQTPIVALTGYEADVVKYDCKAYSMEGAITKPLSPEQAKQIIQYYVYKQDIIIEGLKKA